MGVRIVYKDVAPGAENDVTASTSEHQTFSDPTQLGTGADGGSIVTLEPNGWLLDRNRKLLTTQQPAFWGVKLSGDDCKVTPAPWISMELGQFYSSVGITIDFDQTTTDYCTDITIKWYKNDELIADQDFYPDRPLYFCYRIVEFYNRVDVIFNKTSFPGRYIKVNQIIFGMIREFYRDELRNVKIIQRVNLISSDAAINTMNLTIDSKSDVAFMFQNFQTMYAYDDDTLIGVFYVEESTRHAMGLYDVSCQDALGVLDMETVSAKMCQDKNAMELAAEIITDKFKLEYDPELENETVSGYIPDGTRRNALHHIAFALRAIVDTSRTDAVRFFRPKVEELEEINTGRAYVNGSVKLDATVTSVRIMSHSYSATGDSKNTVEVDGVTYYDTQTMHTMDNPNITPSILPKIIEIKNATLVNPSNVEAILQNAYDYYAKRSTHNIKLIMDEERPGDFLTTPTVWGTTVSGNIESMRITMSGIMAADCEVVGSEISDNP